MSEPELYKVTFSNQNMNDLVQGEIRIYGTSIKQVANRCKFLGSILKAGGMFLIIEKAKPDDSLLKVA